MGDSPIANVPRRANSSSQGNGGSWSCCTKPDALIAYIQRCMIYCNTIVTRLRYHLRGDATRVSPKCPICSLWRTKMGIINCWVWKWREDGKPNSGEIASSVEFSQLSLSTRI